MEKLILRSIMYGADKIPDKWFEKVPGGFYKEKEQRDERDRKEKQSQEKEKRSRRNSDGGSDRPRRSDRQRSRDRDDRGDRGDRGDRRDREDRDRNDRKARHSDGPPRRDHRRSRSSYDGYDDFDDEDYERRRREKAHRKRGGADNDRYGYEDGYGRPPRRGSLDNHGPPRRPRDDRRGEEPYNPAEYGAIGSHPRTDHYIGVGLDTRRPPPVSDDLILL